MEGVHPQEDLAPRDVVAAAISRRMAEAPGGIDDHVYLDATHLGERFYTRFPAITAACRAIGVDPARERIPVAPAAHYACGGVPATPRRDDRARRALRGRRGVVHRCARRQPPGIEQPHRERRGRARASGATWPGSCPDRRSPTMQPGGRDGGLVDPAQQGRRPVGDVAPRRACSATPPALDAGSGGARRGSSPASLGRRWPPSQPAFEATNLLTVARAMVAAAAARTESRGCHRRTDHPDRGRSGSTHLDDRACRRRPATVRSSGHRTGRRNR